MIGSRLRQALSPVLALAFALGLLGGAYGLRPCPRHPAAGHAVEGTAPAGPPAAPVAGAAAADHEEGSDGAASCSCLGSCHAGAAAGVPRATGPGVPLLDPVPRAGPRGTRGVAPRKTPAYLHPYALGPPPA